MAAQQQKTGGAATTWWLEESIMTPRLIVAVFAISAMPVYAQAQDPNPVVTAARIVADTISSNPAKIETYCAIGKLSDQIEDANEKKTAKRPMS